MIAILTIVISLGGYQLSGVSGHSVEIYPLADQNAYDHCVDIAKQVKENLIKDLPSGARIATSCVDKGEAVE